MNEVRELAAKKLVKYVIEQIDYDRYQLVYKILNIQDDDEKFESMEFVWAVYQQAVITGEVEPDHVFEKIVWDLRNAIQFENVFWKMKKEQEFGIYPTFRAGFKKLLGDSYEIATEYKKQQKHQVDCMLTNLDGSLVPVEIKKGAFNEKALQQLLRYMNVYRADRGVAIGKSLTVDIPSNINFFSVGEVEKAAAL